MCVFTQVLLFQRVLTSVYPKFNINKFKLSNNRCVNVKQNDLKTTIWQAHETATLVLDHPVLCLFLCLYHPPAKTLQHDFWKCDKKLTQKTAPLPTIFQEKTMKANFRSLTEIPQLMALEEDDIDEQVSEQLYKYVCLGCFSWILVLAATIFEFWVGAATIPAKGNGDDLNDTGFLGSFMVLRLRVKH